MGKHNKRKTAGRNAPPFSYSGTDSLAARIERALSGKYSRYNNNVFMCNTPEILLRIGCKQLPMYYTIKHLKKALKPKNRAAHCHGLSGSVISDIPDLIKNPVMIYDSVTRSDSIVIVTDKFDKDKCPIVVTVCANGNVERKNGFGKSNFITSIYGRENFPEHLKSILEKDKLLYCSKEKSLKLFSVLGLEFPKGLNNSGFDSIIHLSRNIVNTQIENNLNFLKKIREEKPMSYSDDELLRKLTEMVGGNTEVMREVLDKINSLETKVAVQTKQLESVTEQLAEVTEKQEVFSAHLNQIYNSQSIEETLAVMGEMGKSDMDAEQCNVYSYDAFENKLFTVDENKERVYTDISENSPVGAALLKNKVFLQSQYEGGLFGDDKEEKAAKNVAVIPIESKSGDVIGVVVAKDKKKRFTREDVDKFDLKKGKIGSAFRMGFENKALKQAAVTDKLTHLHNRQGAEQFLKNSVLPKLQSGEKMSTIMIDIDKFKNFNDTYGHDVGDRVLKQVADILKDNVRDEDGVFRWGGEEMVVIAAMNSSDAYALAERLRQTIQDTPLDVDGKRVRITASMGVAGITAENIQGIGKNNIMKFFEERPLKLADERLYKAKESGRNMVVAPDKVMEKYDVRDRRIVSIIDGIRREQQKQEQKAVLDNSRTKKKNAEIE